MSMAGRASRDLRRYRPAMTVNCVSRLNCTGSPGADPSTLYTGGPHGYFDYPTSHPTAILTVSNPTPGVRGAFNEQQ
jgi:hypothetical protein